MKKFERMQVDLLKAMFHDHPVVHGTLNDGRIAMGFDSCLVFVPTEEILIRFTTEEYTVNKIFENASWNIEPADYVYTLELSTDKRKVAKFQTDSGKVAYVDTGYLKYFDKNARFFVKSHKEPVCVYEGDELAGIILPVNMTEREN